MPDMSIKDQHDLARLIARVIEVNSLDTVWTEHSGKGHLNGRQEVDELRTVTEVMHRGIGEIVRDLGSVQRGLDGREKEIDDQVTRLLDAGDLGPGVRARLAAHFQASGGFAGYVRQSIDQVRAQGLAAADDVRHQMDRLAGGAKVEGDLWQQIKCALLGAAAGAAAASGNWWGLVPIFVAADNTGCIPH